jgi:predicted nuclease of predicted toxin-antitoxin system
MARLYANENFPLPVVLVLRDLGHDVITVSETGKAEQAWPDEAVLEYATQDDRAILTFNRRHFIRLHNQDSNHSGIITCTYDPDFELLGARINATVKNVTTLKSQLLRINRPG